MSFLSLPLSRQLEELDSKQSLQPGPHVTGGPWGRSGFVQPHQRSTWARAASSKQQARESQRGTRLRKLNTMQKVRRPAQPFLTPLSLDRSRIMAIKPLHARPASQVSTRPSSSGTSNNTAKDGTADPVQRVPSLTFSSPLAARSGGFSPAPSPLKRPQSAHPTFAKRTGTGRAGAISLYA
jgi:hypothetical protein